MGKRDDRWLARVYALTDVQVRAAGDGEGPVIDGYAAVFDRPSEDLGGFREVIRPGAFAKTLQEGDPRATVNHNPDYVLGRRSAETLMLHEDGQGLKVSIKPPDTQWARDFMTSMARGDIDQMSFMFRSSQSDWVDGSAETDWLPLWVQREVQLLDVSVVTFPAYTETEAHLRSLGFNLWTPEPPGPAKPGLSRSGERATGHSETDKEAGTHRHTYAGADVGQEPDKEDPPRSPPQGGEGCRAGEGARSRLGLMRARLELVERTL